MVKKEEMTEGRKEGRARNLLNWFEFMRHNTVEMTSIFNVYSSKLSTLQHTDYASICFMSMTGLCPMLSHESPATCPLHTECAGSCKISNILSFLLRAVAD